MTGLSSFPTSERRTPTLTGMTLQYAARRVVLEDDSEPTGLASEWVDGPAPRHAYEVAEEIPTAFDSYGPAPSKTPGWHIAVEPSTPLAPGPVHAATPVTVGHLTDPASFPTPVSNFASVSYQSIQSPVPQPYAASTPVSDEVDAAGVTVVAAASIQRKVFGLVIVGISLAPITTVGAFVGGNVWWTVGFAWAVGIILIAGILMPGRMRLRRSALK